MRLSRQYPNIILAIVSGMVGLLVGVFLAVTLIPSAPPPPQRFSLSEAQCKEQIKEPSDWEVAAIAAVKKSLFRPEPWNKPFFEGWETGALSGGIAVLVHDHGAYWVDAKGTVSAGNGVAKAWSPGIVYAPVGIDITSIRRAVRDPVEADSRLNGSGKRR